MVRWDGVVTAEEFLSHVRRLIADVRWPPEPARHLTDLRSAMLDPSIDASVMQSAADLFGSRRRIANLRVAIVAGDEFAKAREFEALIAPYQPLLFVFNSLRPACEWLGVDAEDVGRILQSLHE